MTYTSSIFSISFFCYDEVRVVDDLINVHRRNEGCSDSLEMLAAELIMFSSFSASNDQSFLSQLSRFPVPLPFPLS